MSASRYGSRNAGRRACRGCGQRAVKLHDIVSRCGAKVRAGDRHHGASRTAAWREARDRRQRRGSQRIFEYRAPTLGAPAEPVFDVSDIG